MSEWISVSGEQPEVPDYIALWFEADNEPDPAEARWEAWGLYMASRSWQMTRRAVLDRARGTCERCHQPYLRLRLHHITYCRRFAERLTDLMALCEPCHRFVSAKSDVDPLKLVVLERPDEAA